MPINSNRFGPITAASILLANLICVTIPTGFAQEVRKEDDDTAKKEYRARIRERITYYIDNVFYEFDDLKDKISLTTRVELAEQLIKLLAQKRSAQCRKLLDSLFSEVLDALGKDSESSIPSSSVNEQRSLTLVINKILRIAAGMSGKLARDYINKYMEAEREIEKKKSHPSSDYYLRLGIEAVEANPNLAFDIGQEFLKQKPKINTSVLRFMYQLSEKDASLADKFLIDVLRNIKFQKGRDVNELLLIYSYAFGLNVIPTVSPKGISTLYVPYKPLSGASPVSPATVRLFLMVASEILLDDSRYDSNFAQLIWGAEGDLFAIKIIESHASQSFPQVSASLRERRDFLVSYLSAERVSLVASEIDKWSEAAQQERMRQNEEASPEDQDTLLQRAEKSAKPDERDRLYYEAANLAIEKREYREAVEICEKMSDSLRASAKDFIAFTIAQIEHKQGRPDAAREWAKQVSDLTQRVCLLTLIAQSLASRKQKEFDRIMDILGEAESIVSGIKDAREKVYVLAGIGTVFSHIGHSKAFDYLYESIAQTNRTDTFPSATSLTRTLKVGDHFFSYSFYDQKLSLSELIFQQAKKNFFETSFLVDSLKSPLARFRAGLTLCKAGLESV